MGRSTDGKPITPWEGSWADWVSRPIQWPLGYRYDAKTLPVPSPKPKRDDAIIPDTPKD